MDAKSAHSMTREERCEGVHWWEHGSTLHLEQSWLGGCWQPTNSCVTSYIMSIWITSVYFIALSAQKRKKMRTLGLFHFTDKKTEVLSEVTYLKLPKELLHHWDHDPVLWTPPCSFNHSIRFPTPDKNKVNNSKCFALYNFYHVSHPSHWIPITAVGDSIVLTSLFNRWGKRDLTRW